VISLIAWSIFFGLAMTIVDLIELKPKPFQNLFTPMFVSFVGLVLFGFIGSLFWTITYFLINRLCLSEFIKHLISASISTIATPILFSALLNGQNLFDKNKLGTIYLMLILIVPVVLVSLIVYRKRYIKTIT
jgi:hypothetical protein